MIAFILVILGVFLLFKDRIFELFNAETTPPADEEKTEQNTEETQNETSVQPSDCKNGVNDSKCEAAPTDKNQSVIKKLCVNSDGKLTEYTCEGKPGEECPDSVDLKKYKPTGTCVLTETYANMSIGEIKLAQDQNQKDAAEKVKKEIDDAVKACVEGSSFPEITGKRREDVCRANFSPGFSGFSVT